MGYEAMREQTLATPEAAGDRPRRHRAAAAEPDRHARDPHRPDGKPFPALDMTRPWDSLNDDEKRLFARMAEVYAGFLATPTTTLAACSTTSSRPTSSTTR